MGFLRFILALSVVIAHSAPIFGLTIVGGTIAVQAFYIISGFYMSLILNEKYIGVNSYSTFITNRFLRLFPSYWVVLILTVVIWLLLGKGETFFKPYLQYYSGMNIISFLYLVFTNIFMFGQDVVIFLKLNLIDGSLLFDNYKTVLPASIISIEQFILVPQAWSLGIELSFYIIAPFIVRRNIWFIFAVMALSIAVRIYIYSIGLKHGAWNFRFFPNEVLFFLAGSISYKIYNRIKSSNINKKYLSYAFYFASLFILLYQFIPGGNFKIPILHLFLMMLVPLIFLYTKDNKFDYVIGELSYPMYISHVSVINLLMEYKINNSFWQGIGATVLTTLVAILLLLLIIKPLEAYRQKRVKRKEVLVQESSMRA